MLPHITRGGGGGIWMGACHLSDEPHRKAMSGWRSVCVCGGGGYMAGVIDIGDE